MNTDASVIPMAPLEAGFASRPHRTAAAIGEAVRRLKRALEPGSEVAGGGA
jgi:hypothetical protein